MILGIDPGFTGAIVGISSEVRRISFATMMPTGIETLLSGKERKVLDIEMCRQVISHAIVEEAYIEMVGTRPKESPVAAFRFGEGFGILKGIMSASKIPFFEIRPNAWKIAAGISKLDKEAAIDKAKEVFPEDAHIFETKRGVRNKAQAIAIADAALIAYFGAEVTRKRKSG